jgi:hypothetical protein
MVFRADEFEDKVYDAIMNLALKTEDKHYPNTVYHRRKAWLADWKKKSTNN